MITAAAVAEAQRKKEVELVEAQREAQKQAIAITVAAEAEKDAAQNHALAVTTRAAANLRNYEAEAEGQKRINEAIDRLSVDQVADAPGQARADRGDAQDHPGNRCGRWRRSTASGSCRWTA